MGFFDKFGSSKNNKKAVKNMNNGQRASNASANSPQQARQMPADPRTQAKRPVSMSDPNSPKKTYGTIMAEMDAMIGLESARAKAVELMELSKFHANMRSLNPNAVIPYMNTVLIHNEGLPVMNFINTIAEMYENVGFLPTHNVARFICQDFFPLNEQAINNTIASVLGGILFIDNFETCINDESYNPELPALMAMLNNVAYNCKNQLVIVYGGTATAMDALFTAFPDTYLYFSKDKHIVMSDYTPEEMSQIFELTLNSKNMELDDEARAFLPMFFQYHIDTDIAHENVIGVEKLIEQTIYAQNVRLSSQNLDKRALREVMSIITAEDLNKSKIANAMDFDGSKHKNKLDVAMNTLKDMIGLQAVKNKLTEIIATTEAEKVRQSRSENTSKQNVTRHMMFVGNPGTGKTTVAHVIADIFCEMGILDNNVVVEASKSDLVGKYVGHTTPKTQKVFESAIGGILFIDEAYNLDPMKDENGTKDPFCDECITELVRLMEIHRNNTIVIIAGYEKEIEHLLDANAGLRSRFSQDNKIVFEDYSMSELVEIFKYQVSKRKLSIHPSADNILLPYVTYWFDNTKDFGNARGIRNLVDKAYNRMNIRLRSIGFDNVSDEELSTLMPEDFDLPDNVRGTISGRPGDTVIVSRSANLGALSDTDNVTKVIKKIANKMSMEEYRGNPKVNGEYTDAYKHWFAKYYKSMRSLFFDDDGNYKKEFLDWVKSSYGKATAQNLTTIIQLYAE